MVESSAQFFLSGGSVVLLAASPVLPLEPSTCFTQPQLLVIVLNWLCLSVSKVPNENRHTIYPTLGTIH